MAIGLPTRSSLLDLVFLLGLDRAEIMTSTNIVTNTKTLEATRRRAEPLGSGRAFNSHLLVTLWR